MAHKDVYLCRNILWIKRCRSVCKRGWNGCNFFEDMAESPGFGNRPAFQSRACCFLLSDIEQLNSLSLSFLKYKFIIGIILWGIVAIKQIIVFNISHKKGINKCWLLLVLAFSCFQYYILLVEKDPLSGIVKESWLKIPKFHQQPGNGAFIRD